MARTTEQINTQIVSTLVAQFLAIGITIDSTKWSKRNIMRLFCYTFAIVSAYIEQLSDSLKLSIENTASKAAAANALWIQLKMFEFQYSSTNPQFLQILNTIPQYLVVDITLRVITACSVTSTAPNQVTIKVASGVATDLTPFFPLTVPQVEAAQSYINILGTAGINYTVISLDADKLYIDADVYYSGQYSSVIQSSVITAITTFLHNLSIANFNGALKMTDLESVIRKVDGVNDVVMNGVRIRENTVLFAAGVDLIINRTTLQRLWNPIAGYIEQETTSGKTFADTLNFIAE